MADSSSPGQEIKEIAKDLKNLSFEYQTLFYSEDNSIVSKSFVNPENALNFFMSIASEQNPVLKVLITASRGNFSYTCLAPMWVISLTEIVGNGNLLPVQIEAAAREAVATRIYKNLPFNSESHGYII